MGAGARKVDRNFQYSGGFSLKLPNTLIPIKCKEPSMTYSWFLKIHIKAFQIFLGIFLFSHYLLSLLFPNTEVRVYNLHPMYKE